MHISSAENNQFSANLSAVNNSIVKHTFQQQKVKSYSLFLPMISEFLCNGQRVAEFNRILKNCQCIGGVDLSVQVNIGGRKGCIVKLS